MSSGWSGHPQKGKRDERFQGFIICAKISPIKFGELIDGSRLMYILKGMQQIAGQKGAIFFQFSCCKAFFGRDILGIPGDFLEKHPKRRESIWRKKIYSVDIPLANLHESYTPAWTPKLTFFRLLLAWKDPPNPKCDWRLLDDYRDIVFQFAFFFVRWVVCFFFGLRGVFLGDLLACDFWAPRSHRMYPF